MAYSSRLAVAAGTIGLPAARGQGCPPDTRFLRDAKAQGCTTIDGLGMLINQGVIGVKYWTGIDADPAAMRAASPQTLTATLMRRPRLLMRAGRRCITGRS